MRKADPALHKKRREQIMRAAESCFVQKGFHQTSMQEIAKASNLSMGLLYRYFTNKNEIIASVATQDQNEIVKRIERLKKVSNFFAALKKFCKARLKETTHPAYMRLATETLSEACRTKELRKNLTMNEIAIRNAMTEVLQEQQKVGHLSATVDTTSFSELLFAMLEGLATRIFLDPSFSRKSIETVINNFLKNALKIE